MSSDAAARAGKLSRCEQLRCARKTLERERQTLDQLARRLDHEFCRAVEYLYTCRGSVIVSRMADAVELMARRKISELPVVDAEGKPVGLIDVTDVVGMLPQATVEGPGQAAKPECRVFREPDGRQSA